MINNMLRFYCIQVEGYRNAVKTVKMPFVISPEWIFKSLDSESQPKDSALTPLATNGDLQVIATVGPAASAGRASSPPDKAEGTGT